MKQATRFTLLTVAALTVSLFSACGEAVTDSPQAAEQSAAVQQPLDQQEVFCRKFGKTEAGCRKVASRCFWNRSRLLCEPSYER